MARPFVKQDPSLPQGFSITFRERFWARVNKNGPIPSHMAHLGQCWIWNGAPGSHGYGCISPGGRRYGRETSHRASWILHNGPIPEGMFVLHACDNRLCVRLSHLFLGTHADNLKDAAAKGRMAHGEGGRHTLSESSVAEIRAKYRPTIVSEAMLAREYGVSPSNIHKILKGTAWRHSSNGDVSAKGIKIGLHGIHNPSAKLDWNAVRFMRTHYIPRSRQFNLLAFARQYGIAQSAVWSVLHHKTWKE